MSQTYNRNRFTWLMYLQLALYGYFLNILGPITPFLMDELRLSYTLSSLHFTAFAFGIILAGLGGHLVIRRIGRGNALWVGAFGMSGSAALLIMGRTPVMTIGASFLMGLVGSLILAVVPSALADQHGEMRSVALSEANVVASLVSAASPLLVGWFASQAVARSQVFGGWRLALAVGLLIPLLLRLGIGKVRMPPESAKEPAQERRPLPALYWVYWMALVLAISVEFCMIFWSADYLEKILSLPKATAAQAVSLFLGGMILGRLGSSRLVRRFQISSLVTASLLMAAAGFLLYWGTSSSLLGVAGLFFTGLGVASLYPLILSLAIGAAHGNSVQASARSSLASGVAIFSLPLVLGRLADAVGIRPAYSIILLLLLGVFAIIQITTRRVAVGEPVTG